MTARDPILFAGGQNNLYAYVNNDPINRRDSTGLAGGWLTDLGESLYDIFDSSSDAGDVADAAEHISYCKSIRTRAADAVCDNKL